MSKKNSSLCHNDQKFNKLKRNTGHHWSEGPSSIKQHTSAGEDVEKGDPSALLVGMQTGAATVESRGRDLKKLKNGSAF